MQQQNRRRDKAKGNTSIREYKGKQRTIKKSSKAIKAVTAIILLYGSYFISFIMIEWSARSRERWAS